MCARLCCNKILCTQVVHELICIYVVVSYQNNFYNVDIEFGFNRMFNRCTKLESADKHYIVSLFSSLSMVYVWLNSRTWFICPDVCCVAPYARINNVHHVYGLRLQSLLSFFFLLLYVKCCCSFFYPSIFFYFVECISISACIPSSCVYVVVHIMLFHFSDSEVVNEVQACEKKPYTNYK